MKSIYVILALLIYMGMLAACGSGPQQEQTTETSATAESEETYETSQKEEEPEEEPLDRQTYESKLAALDIEIYETAEFYAVEERRYGDGVQLVYTIADNSDEKIRAVRLFYDEMFDEIAEERGLQRADIDHILGLRDSEKKLVSVHSLKRLTDDKHLLTFMFTN